jgi:hypothetical protein
VVSITPHYEHEARRIAGLSAQREAGRFADLETGLKSESGKYNALWHVLLHKAEEAKVTLSTRTSTDIEFEVEDNDGERRVAVLSQEYWTRQNSLPSGSAMTFQSQNGSRWTSMVRAPIVAWCSSSIRCTRT